MYTSVCFRIHEREQSAFCHDSYSMEKHTSLGGQKQQQHDDAANLVSQFINEEISVTMRKTLEMEGKSYPQDDQHSSQLSSSKKSKSVSHEVAIRENGKSTFF